MTRPTGLGAPCPVSGPECVTWERVFDSDNVFCLWGGGREVGVVRGGFLTNRLEWVNGSVLVVLLPQGEGLYQV